MKPKISIIVPIYNVAPYLARCLDSILNGTYDNIEVLAINDGSQDESLTILKEYAKCDSRVIVIEQVNQGVSAARNLGLSRSSGEYIGFVDGDDWIEPDMYAAMIQEAQKLRADIVMCSYIREFGTHAKVKQYEESDRTVYMNEQVQQYVTRRLVGPLDEELAKPEQLDAWGTVWSKIYRSELIQKRHIQFVPLHEIGSNEDTLFNIQASSYASCVVFLNRPYYHYWRGNEHSITSTYNPQLRDQFQLLYKKMEILLIERSMSDQVHLALQNRIVMNVLGLGLNIISRRKQAPLRVKLRELHRLLHSPYLTGKLEEFVIRGLPMHWRMFFLLVKQRHTLLVYMMLQVIEALRKRNIRGDQNGAITHLTSRHSNESGRPGDHAHELLQTNGSKQHSV